MELKSNMGLSGFVVSLTEPATIFLSAVQYNSSVTSLYVKPKKLYIFFKR